MNRPFVWRVDAGPITDGGGATRAFARRSSESALESISAPGSRSTLGFRDVDASALIEVT
ncbi:hypothetical protein WS48_28555 [Burkholderia sp. RF7-non_BP1]|nr:hypothetical protein WS48_28555 [Burkholderia sp. RF7-non_BP1]KUY94164.1 hypothetical protein WS49_24465 [Burkholderia sp. RF7-non_BP4]